MRSKLLLDCSIPGGGLLSQRLVSGLPEYKKKKLDREIKAETIRVAKVWKDRIYNYSDRIIGHGIGTLGPTAAYMVDGVSLHRDPQSLLLTAATTLVAGALVVELGLQSGERDHRTPPQRGITAAIGGFLTGVFAGGAVYGATSPETKFLINMFLPKK